MSARRSSAGSRSVLARRELRLGSGLVLFTYIASHLVNHALGLASVALAERGLTLAMRLWHSAPGTALLYGAATIHLALAFLSVYERRTLRIPPLELLRIALGFGMPLLLIGHIAATRLMFELHGHVPQYARTVWSLWASDSEGRQLALLAPGWLHGCLGLHFAFNRRAWFGRIKLVLFALMLLLPVLSGLGFIAMGRELAMRAVDPLWLAANITLPDAAQRIAMARVRDAVLALYVGLIVATLVAREVRAWLECARGGLIQIAYPGRNVRVPRGWSVLEASRSFGVAHQSMCGGRARCSTCRVRVTAGEADCPAPAEDELRTLERIGAQPDVRLACQLRPVGNVTVVPLLATASAKRDDLAGQTIEREVVVMLIDLDNWDALAANRLPQDQLYLLRLFSEAVCAAITQAGGEVNPQQGEHLLAVFGRTQPLAAGARAALAAADQITQRVEQINLKLEREFGCRIVLRIRVHAGNAVVGEVGHGEARALAVTGEALAGARALRAEARSTLDVVLSSEAVARAAGQQSAAAVAGAASPD